MSEIVFPLYLAMGLVFLGTTIASWQAHDRRLLTNERANWLDVSGGVFATLASLCIALVPYAGRVLLPFSTLFIWFCLLATCLRVRSWRVSVSPGQTYQWFGVLTGVCILMVGQFLANSPQWQRVVFQLGMSLGLLTWLCRELQKLMRLQPSLQLNLMSWSAMAMALVLVVWSWSLVASDVNSPSYQISPMFTEVAWAFSMRLFLVATLVLLLTGANGYATERLVNLKTELGQRFVRTQELNQDLQLALHEKDQMLQTLSFAVRSQNLPAIASSLTHEINQPLGALRLNMDYLLAEGDQMTRAEHRDVLEQMVKCSEATNAVVISFRRFFEVQSDWKLFDVQSMLDDLMHGLRADFLRKGIQVTLSPGLPVWIHGDPVQFESAVAGVIELMSVDMREVCSRLRVDCRVQGAFMVLRLMSEDLAASKSEFQKAFDESKKAKSGSFRPGLWLSRAIVEHHGGAMSVCEDKETIGFSLQLPFSRINK